MRYDLAIIGSGSAAFAAAISARDTGASVVMIERGTIGGTCVNTGCVPSKALLAAAEARQVAAGQSFPGIVTSAGAVTDADFAALIGGKDDMVEQLRGAKYTELAASYGFDFLQGEARFASGPVLDVTRPTGDSLRVDAERYLIATGSAPWAPPIAGLAEAGYLTSTTAMELETVPESLIVIGGNAIGLEQGQMFARLGVAVTVIEALDRLAPFEEPEVSAGIELVLAEEGIAVYTGARVTSVARDAVGGILVTTSHGDRESTIHADRLLVAAGRRPVTAALDPEAAGVKVGEAGEIVVDEQLRTSNPRIWAAGDVTGAPQLVYVAAAQGTLAARNAIGGAGETLDYAALPRVTFTSPGIASAGLTHAQAVQHGIACESRTLPLDQVPRAIVNRDTRGLVKLVAEQGTGRLLGAHVLADGAGDLITAATYALTAGMTTGQLAGGWHPYLTMAEALKLAAQTFTRDVTRLSCCAA